MGLIFFDSFGLSDHRHPVGCEIGRGLLQKLLCPAGAADLAALLRSVAIYVCGGPADRALGKGFDLCRAVLALVGLSAVSAEPPDQSSDECCWTAGGHMVSCR